MFGEKLFLSPPSYKRCFYSSFHTSQSTELAIFNWIPCFLMLRGWDKASKNVFECLVNTFSRLSSLYMTYFQTCLSTSTFSIDDMPNKMGGSWEFPPVFLSEYFIEIRHDPTMWCSFCQPLFKQILFESIFCV